MSFIDFFHDERGSFIIGPLGGGGGGISSVSWGDILGDITDQLDLQSALNDKHSINGEGGIDLTDPVDGGTISLNPPSQPSTYTITLPANSPGDNTYLKHTTSGSYSWASASVDLSAYAPLDSPTFTTRTRHSYATAGRIPYFDSNKDLVASALGYSTVYGANDPTVTASASLTVQVGGSDHTYFSSSNLAIVGSRHLYWNTNGAGDIGANTSNRPRYVYANSGFVAKGDHYYQDAVGKSMIFTTGTNAKIGTGATLVAGTVTVSTTAVTANSMIILTKTAAGGTEGFVSVTKSAGTSFTITSSSGTDTSVFDWFIIERQ